MDRQRNWKPAVISSGICVIVAAIGVGMAWKEGVQGRDFFVGVGVAVVMGLMATAFVLDGTGILPIQMHGRRGDGARGPRDGD